MALPLYLTKSSRALTHRRDKRKKMGCCRMSRALREPCNNRWETFAKQNACGWVHACPLQSSPLSANMSQVHTTRDNAANVIGRQVVMAWIP